MNTLRWLMAGCAFAAALPTLAAPIPSGPIYTNKQRFRIPFHYDAAEMQRIGAKEIRLYLSRDRGRTWQQTQAVAPGAGKFPFQAQADGEYWFNVRTLDARSRLYPEGEVKEPALQVIVDTTPPRLSLELRQPVAGKVHLTWQASDAHLDPTQLRLECLQPGAADWQTVSVVPRAAGQTDWVVARGGVVAVRGSISDFAGNVTEDRAELRAAGGNQIVPRPAAPDLRQPVAVDHGASRQELALNMPDEFPVPSRRAARGLPAAVAQAPASALEQSADEFAPLADRPKPPDNGRDEFVSYRNEPEADSGGVSPAGEPRAAAPPARAVRERAVPSRKFLIGYQLEDVGPSGVARVDLYITEDQGATWYLYGTDDDRQSPVAVEVPREGTYGFALGVESGAGLASDPPRSGDPPAIRVVVDETPPAIELLPLEQGRGKSQNKLRVSWKYTDEHPADDPVQLLYSPNGRAPWQSISGWIANTGSYVWTTGPGVPARFHLRIEARDAAGNIRSVETPEPVLVDLARPTVKILDVAPPANP